jgi:hypothetical protein
VAGRQLWTGLYNLVAVDLVTAEGQLLTVSADDHPELCWGVRGDEKAYHDEMISGLQTQGERPQHRIDQAYADKLDGKIPEDLCRKPFDILAEGLSSADWLPEQVKR